MKSSRKTFAELQAWLDTWNANGAAPSAEAVVNFLGIELARRSPEGVEVIKTDNGTTYHWRRYWGKSRVLWFTDAEVEDWEIVLAP